MMDELKKQICEIGRRAWSKGFVVANEGNISVRLDERRLLCTPTLTCKGFMKPEDLCVVDLVGNRIEGSKRPTSEIKLHLNVYQHRPDIRCVFHSHPPHATAFAVVGQSVPRNVLAEPEMFLGNVPLAPYAMPGSEEFTHAIDPYVCSTNAILLSNHGVVTYHKTAETAFWLTEILDSYCRTLINARALGTVQKISVTEADRLGKLRRQLGYEP